MRFHQFVLDQLIKRVAQRRVPDHVIGSIDDPYLLRWYVIPRNPVFNIYFHRFMRSDDDRALHDHPWWNLSWVLHGKYFEYRPVDPKRPAGQSYSVLRRPGALVFRRAKDAHRVALISGPGGREWPAWTLFITGPKIRAWGFWCPGGWRHWKRYTEETRPGVSEIGAGCGEE